MKILSPTKLITRAAGNEWFRLARTEVGLLYLESISDRTLHRSGPPAAWAFGGDVSPHIAKQLEDDEDSDQVAKVLERALRALGFA